MLTQRNTPRVKLKILYCQKYFLPLFSLNLSRPKFPFKDHVLFFFTSGFSSCSVKRMCWVKHCSPPADAFFHIPLHLFLLVHFQCTISISHLRTLPFLPCSIQTSSFSLFCHVFYFLYFFFSSFLSSLLQLSPFPS